MYDAWGLVAKKPKGHWRPFPKHTKSNCGAVGAAKRAGASSGGEGGGGLPGHGGYVGEEGGFVPPVTCHHSTCHRWERVWPTSPPCSSPRSPSASSPTSWPSRRAPPPPSPTCSTRSRTEGDEPLQHGGQPVGHHGQHPAQQVPAVG